MGVEPAIDISAEQRETILALLERHLPGTAAWVYGSRTKWTSRPQSDLDLVVFSTPEQRAQVGALRDAFEESDLPFRVDLFVWDDVPEAFHEKIETEHVALVSSDVRRVNLGWNETTLGDVIELKRGYDLPRQQRISGAVPVVSSSGVIDYHQQSKVSGPGVVIGRYGTLGQVFFIRDDYWPLNTALYVRDFKGNDPRFISYFLESLDVSTYSDKAAVPGINRNHLHQEVVCIPSSTAEQRGIAHVLGTLDDKIELIRHMNKTLEAMARALFKSWFVDFDPVRAKMEGRDSYFDSAIWDVFPDTLDEEGKPKGWQETELGDRVEILDAKRIPLSSRERQKRQGPFPYHGAAGVLDHIDDYLFDGVHVLLGEDGSVIRADGTPFTQYVWGKFWVNNHAHVLKGKSISDEMLLCFLEQIDIAPFVTGAVQPKLNQKNLKSVPFPPADPRMAACFQRATEPLFTQLRINVEQSQSLTVLRDTLLPKLISGDVRLREAEMAVEAVA